MNKFQFSIKVLPIAMFMFAFASLAQAQATRTWVSAVGDDMNSCSRTSPCKTFSGAYSNTAAGGEINALDPGGYGTLNINKPITVDGGTGSGWAGVLATNSYGIYVNIANGSEHEFDAVVTLRNLSFNGISQSSSSPGTNGIYVVEAPQLHVEHCLFQNFSTNGIRAAMGPNTGVITVQDCVFDNVNTVITSDATAPAYVVIQFERNRAVGSVTGINANTNTYATVRDSFFGSFTGANGAVRAGTGSLVNVLNSTLVNNNIGVNVAGGTVRLSNNQFFHNTTAISGTAESANNNKFSGNSTDGTTTNVITIQ